MILRGIMLALGGAEVWVFAGVAGAEELTSVVLTAVSSEV